MVGFPRCSRRATPPGRPRGRSASRAGPCRRVSVRNRPWPSGLRAARPAGRGRPAGPWPRWRPPPGGRALGFDTACHQLLVIIGVLTDLRSSGPLSWSWRAEPRKRPDEDSHHRGPHGPPLALLLLRVRALLLGLLLVLFLLLQPCFGRLGRVVRLRAASAA